MKKRITLIIVSVIVLVGVMFGAVCCYYLTNRASIVFKQDKKDIATVAAYLAATEHEYAYIKGSTDMLYASHVSKINDSAVIDSVDSLLNKKGYKEIVKNGNTVYFVKWTRLADYSSGFAYSINGVDAPVIMYLTKTEPLSEKGWYFFEADYNEWRMHQ